MRYPYELATNDPAHPLITFALVADVKRLPEIYRRLKNGDYLNGQRVSTFEVWPTASPFITMEKGEHLTLPLRVWRGQLDVRVANTGGEAPINKTGMAVGQPPSGEMQARLPFPPGAVKYGIRAAGDKRGFWVDLDITGVDKAGLFEWSANVADPSTGESFPVGLSALVYEENLIMNPRSLDTGDVSLAALEKSPIIAAQFNLRKMIGSIQIKGVSSSLAFVKGGVQILVDGSNYLIKAYIVANPGVGPGKYEGTLRVETDDSAHRRIEVPLKVTLVP